MPLTATYRISHAMGIKTYKGVVKSPCWTTTLNLDRLNKSDAIHDARLEIDLLKSISANPDTQF